MITIAAIDHAVFRVRDMEGMIRFYRDVLGTRIERRNDEIGLVQMRAGSALIDLVDVAKPLGRAGGAPPGAEAHNVDHVCLRVLPWNGDEILAHLAAHGITGVEVTSRYGAQGEGPSIYIADPEGNRLELKGPPWPPQRPD